MVRYASGNFFSYAVEAIQLPVNIFNGDVTIVAFVKLEQILCYNGDMYWVADCSKLTQKVMPGHL